MLCPDSKWGRHSISMRRWPFLCLEAHYHFLNHLFWDKPSVPWAGLCCWVEIPLTSCTVWLQQRNRCLFLRELVITQNINKTVDEHSVVFRLSSEAPVSKTAVIKLSFQMALHEKWMSLTETVLPTSSWNRYCWFAFWILIWMNIVIIIHILYVPPVYVWQLC